MSEPKSHDLNAKLTLEDRQGDHPGREHLRQDWSERRVTRIGMPEMAIGGLSEAWLFREIGDMHWSTLSKALGRPTGAIVEPSGARLYATFIRVRFEMKGHLKSAKENDSWRAEYNLNRADRFIWTGQGNASAGTHNVSFDAISAFARREGNGNSTLLKSAPDFAGTGPTSPDSARQTYNEYRELRRGQLKAVRLVNYQLPVGDQNLFTREHNIIPGYEVNGVNLLYFAAYPIIHETYEREFMNANRGRFDFQNDWAIASATVAKDVCYFANCDINDKIVYTLNHVEQVDSNHYAFCSSLRRASDRTLIARIFTIRTTEKIRSPR